MSIESKRHSDSATADVRGFVQRLFAAVQPRDFAVRLWDGSAALAPGEGETARFTLVLRHAGAARRMFWIFDNLSIGESYIYSDIDVEGDMEHFVATLLAVRNNQFAMPLAQRVSTFWRLVALPRSSREHSKRGARLTGVERSADRDRQAIEYHYDTPPSEFFGQFLDRYMQYTCGYFADVDDDIDTAQERKLEYICRKLRLRPGERLVDFGCGWGGLITYAAKHYGVEAVGVSISKEQIKWTEREIERMSVGDRCRVTYCDYREFADDQPFDKAVSVGFIEHLGEKMMPVFFGKVWRLLRPQGLYLHHGITMRPFTPYPPWRAFALKYVFPDGELVPITNTLHELARAGFEIRDVESLREHYVWTLRAWLRRLEQNRDHALRLTDEVFYRIYRIYLAGAILGFRNGTYNLHQSLVAKSGNDVGELPLTRADLYD